VFLHNTFWQHHQRPPRSLAANVQRTNIRIKGNMCGEELTNIILA
jgi:hypothetical protein